MIMFNELCRVTSSKGRVKENMFERVMRATNVLLNFSVSSAVEDRRVRWTTYSNLHAVSLDGSKMNAGGRPAVSFHDPHFPLTQRPAAKSSLSCTGIFGSNAAGECVPIHWQLPTAAMTEDCVKL